VRGATRAAGPGGGDHRTGPGPQAPARAAKPATTGKESVGARVEQLANAQPDKLAGPADAPVQHGRAAPAADPSAPTAPQALAAAAAATNAANVPAAPAAQAAATIAAVPLARVARGIAARAQAGPNRLDIPPAPPPLRRPPPRPHVRRQSHLPAQ